MNHDETTIRLNSADAEITELRRQLQKRDAEISVLQRRLLTSSRAPAPAESAAAMRDEEARRERHENEAALQRLVRDHARRAEVLRARVEVLRRALAGVALSDEELESAGITRDLLDGRPGTPGRRPGTPSRRPGTPGRRPGTPSRRPGTPSRRPATPGRRAVTPSHAQGVTSAPLTAADIAALAAGTSQASGAPFESAVRATSARVTSDVTALAAEVAGYADTAEKLRGTVAATAVRCIERLDSTLAGLSANELGNLLRRADVSTAIAHTQTAVLGAADARGEEAFGAQLGALEAIADCACALLR